MTQIDGTVLLGLLVIVGAFVLYEMEGLQPGARWHTISYDAQRNPWLAWLIAGLGVVALIIFELWWKYHLTTNIPQ